MLMRNNTNDRLENTLKRSLVHTQRLSLRLTRKQNKTALSKRLSELCALRKNLAYTMYLSEQNQSGQTY